MQIISERRQCEKAHTVCFPRLHMTFWKRQNYGDSEKKKAVVSRDQRAGKMKRQSTENVQGREIILHGTIIVDTLSKLIEGTRPKVNSNGNYVNVGFIFDSKCTPLMRDVNNGGGYSCLEAGSMLEISIPFSQFFCKPIITLEK